MPFTPFHFGVAAAVKAAIPRHFSLTAFIFSQVIIDLEVLYFMLVAEPPLHRFLHTFAGATLVCFATVVIGKPVCEVWLILWNHVIAPGAHSRLYTNTKLTYKAVLIGALVGGFSHILLDAIMHLDVKPLAPWSNANIFHGTIDLLGLHFGLVVLGTVGVFWLLLQTLMNRFK